MYRVTFESAAGVSKSLDAEPGENLLELARRAGIDIDVPCGGTGTCGKCRAKLIAGTVDSTRNIHLDDSEYVDGWRLVCQSSVCGDATIWIPPTAWSFKKGIQTSSLSAAEELNRYDHDIRAIFDTGIERDAPHGGYGIAIDIGTTTVAAALIDLETGTMLDHISSGNAQIRYGADVINRIINQSKPEGIWKLQHAVREETVIPLIEGLCSHAGILPQRVIRCVIAGNTTMEHLFLGVDASSIRLEPFVPKFLEVHGKTAREVGLPLAPNASVVFAPNVGSYVGGDITAGVLASRLWTSEEMTLFVDLGTNGELVLGNADFMLCCACSAGPAFEGGDISCGMRATRGAIQALTIDPETLEPIYNVIGSVRPLGLCGSGLVDVVAELFRRGFIDAKGRFTRERGRVRFNEHGRGEYVIAFPSESGTGSAITINETDIDNFIRAKGAIFSATRSMLSSLDMPVDMLDRVIIAGGIGGGINIHNAISIGMLPKIPELRYSYVGNSSLTGACSMLLSADATNRTFELGRNMTYIELSTHPGYMDEFVASCFLPHTDASLFA